MGQRSQPLAQLERDAAIARISRTRRWLIVAAAALTAGFAALISAVAPGRSFAAHSAKAAASRARPVTASARPTAKLPPLEGAQALGLGGPAQAPQAVTPPESSQSQAPPTQSQAPPSQSQVAPSQAQSPSPSQSSPPVVSGGS
jgi:hypothetical protein